MEQVTSITKDLFSGFEVIKGFNISNKINEIFKTPNMEIKITIVGLMENRTTREIINDIKHDIT